MRIGIFLLLLTLPALTWGDSEASVGTEARLERPLEPGTAQDEQNPPSTSWVEVSHTYASDQVQALTPTTMFSGIALGAE